MSWFLQLDKHRGSQPRCVLFMDGYRAEVADRLTQLVDIEEVVVSAEDVWMPYGKPVLDAEGQWDRNPAAEVKLAESNPLIPTEISEALKEWWLAVPRGANTPNWDIASTCKIEGQQGLLLVEAKAHDKELLEASAGKSVGWSDGSKGNHERIGRCIDEASSAMGAEAGSIWGISRDSHYQLSNRFAWSWKLTQLGYPVVLMYLGFLNADEMQDRGEPFRTHDDWRGCVRDHCDGVVPEAVWERTLKFNERSLIPIIRSYEQPFEITAE